MKQQIAYSVSPILLMVLLLNLFGITACDSCKIGPPDNGIQPPITNPNKPPDTLPAATQVGANTFGCKINGDVWVHWIPPIALTDGMKLLISEKNGTGTTNCNVRIWRDSLVNNKMVYHDFTFSFANPYFDEIDLNKVSLNTDILNRFLFQMTVGNQYKWYYPDTSFYNTDNLLSIQKLDTLNNIISGVFKLKLYYGDDYKILSRSDSILITDGRFDIKYQQQ